MKRVLSVDDSSSVRQMVSFTLRQAGYDVAEAADGQDGVEKASKGKFDLVITDLNMPNVDGLQMIGLIRKLPGYSFTPILMLTTESQSEKKDAGRKAGATGWIVKPLIRSSWLRSYGGSSASPLDCFKFALIMVQSRWESRRSLVATVLLTVSISFERVSCAHRLPIRAF